MPTFIERFKLQQEKTGKQMSKKKFTMLHYTIKTVYDRNKNPSPQYVEIEENGQVWLVRNYPDKFTPTIDGLIKKWFDTIPDPNKRKRKRIPIKSPVYSSRKFL